MFQRVRRHLTPSTFIAFIALVFALTGGAFAATGNGGGGSGAKASAAVTPAAVAAKAKAKPKTKAGARGPAGPKGATGATGATGAAGAQGPAGAAGAKGENGTNGTDGTNGAAGESVTVGTASSVECPAGGTKFSNATGKVLGKACDGNPAEYPKALPAGQTETGVWAASGYGEAEYEGQAATAVTYPIPLSEEVHAHTVAESETPPAECPGTVAAPAAEPGNVCIYVESAVNALDKGKLFEIQTLTGFSIKGLTEAKGPIVLTGSWAVTAKE